MNNEQFITLLSLFLIPGLAWACRSLLQERWQILAAIPSAKNRNCEHNSWQGRNLTFYGVLLANGCLAGTTVFLLLCSSIGLTLESILFLAGISISVSMFAASFLAQIIENKKNTMTVAGAATVGLYFIPFCIIVINNTEFFQPLTLPILPVMAALSIGFILGEGLGRLACISFGCCYGRAISDLGPVARRFFTRVGCIFHGHTKKIAYASKLDGVKVVPIQAMTAFLYVTVALICMYLFLENHFYWAFGLSSIVAMGWRILSEQLRADYRGDRRFTLYQLMSIMNICFCLLFLYLVGEPTGFKTDLATGLSVFWNPSVILFLQCIWLGIFLYTGVSKVTGSVVTFRVHTEEI